MRREYSPLRLELEAAAKAINRLGNYNWWLSKESDYVKELSDYTRLCRDYRDYTQSCRDYRDYEQERIVKPNPESPRDKFEAIIRTAKEELDNSKKKTKITLKRALLNSILFITFGILLLTIATTIFPVWLLAVIAIGFCAAMFCFNKAF